MSYASSTNKDTSNPPLYSSPEIAFQKEHEGHIWIDCDCTEHALRVESFVELRGNGRFTQDFYFAIWDQAGRLNFWHRIKAVWRVLWTGKLHEDNVVISYKRMGALRDFLNDKVIEIQSHKENPMYSHHPDKNGPTPV